MSDFDNMLENHQDFHDDFNEDLVEEIQEKATLDEAINALKQKLPAHQTREILTGLSGLDFDEVTMLADIWIDLDVAYRRQLMRRLIAYSEANFDVDYRTLGIYALEDTDPAVREAAIELLWEDESLEVLGKLIRLASSDLVAEVRAAAVTGLGRYIYLGEMADIPAKDAIMAQETVIRLLQDPQEPMAVQRRALEAIANSSHPIVTSSIEEAYRSGNHLMQVSSIFAMGRSYDSRWHDIVLEELESDDAEIQFEAVRAAGELRLHESVPKLGKIIAGGDREMVEMVAWSLGEIGGKESVRILEALAEVAEESNDYDLEEAIEEAIANTVLADMMIDDLDLEQ